MEQYLNITALNLSDLDKTKLKIYSFSGNVGRSKEVINLACFIVDKQEINEDDLTFYDIIHGHFYNSYEKILKEFEAEIITNYLIKYEKNVVLEAEKLAIGKSKIYNLL